MDDGPSHTLVAQGAAGAEQWFATFRAIYEAHPWVHAWEGPNEPPVASLVQRQALVAFTARWVQLMHAINCRTVALCLSVGWPDVGCAGDLGPALEETDYWSVHEYAAPTIQDGGGYLTLRYRRTVAELRAAGARIPPLLITECGIDGGVIAKPRTGWKTYCNGNAMNYLLQLAQYAAEIAQDPYVAGAMVFTSSPSGWEDYEVTQQIGAGMDNIARGYLGRVVMGIAPVVASFQDRMAQLFGASFADLTDSLLTNPGSAYGPFPTRAESAIERIIVHHTASPSATTTPQGIASWDVNGNGWPGSSYHFVIGPAGQVWQTNALTTVSWHAGDANTDSIGIALLGNFEPNVPGIPTETPTPEALAALAATILTIRAYLGRPMGVVGHRDVGATACPGDNLYSLLPQVAAGGS